MNLIPPNFAAGMKSTESHGGKGMMEIFCVRLTSGSESILVFYASRRPAVALVPQVDSIISSIPCRVSLAVARHGGFFIKKKIIIHDGSDRPLMVRIHPVNF